MVNNVLTAEPNVQLAIMAGFISHVILEMLSVHGITVDAETAQDLPTFLILVSAYVPDVVAKWRNKSADIK